MPCSILNLIEIKHYYTKWLGNWRHSSLRITDLYLILNDHALLFTCFWNKCILCILAWQLSLEKMIPIIFTIAHSTAWENTMQIKHLFLKSRGSNEELTAMLLGQDQFFSTCLFGAQGATDTLLNIGNINLNNIFHLS